MGLEEVSSLDWDGSYRAFSYNLCSNIAQKEISQKWRVIGMDIAIGGIGLAILWVALKKK